MKIVVCMKQVPNTAQIDIDPISGALRRDGVTSITNPDDLYALEEALKLKDQFNARVTVITMSLPQAEVILREAMAMGADDSVLLTDKAFAGADTYATSKTLASAIKKINPDLVFTGRQAIDGDTAQVGPQIAEFLDYPQVSYVNKITTTDGKTFTVSRKLGSTQQVVEVSSPCVFTILSHINQPRFMGGGYSKPIQYYNAEDLNLSVDSVGQKGSPTKVFSSHTKQARGSCQIFEKSPEESVEIIYDYLQKIHLIKE